MSESNPSCELANTIYRDSLSNDKEIENAQNLLTYYENNRNELIPYQEQGLDVMKNLPMIT